MLFHSLDFFPFLAVVLSLYFVLPLWGRPLLLFAASTYFYMYWSVKYSSIILFFVVLDYMAARVRFRHPVDLGPRHYASINEGELRSFLDLCQQQGIRALLFEPPNSPGFSELTVNRREILERLDELRHSYACVRFVSLNPNVAAEIPARGLGQPQSSHTARGGKIQPWFCGSDPVLLPRTGRPKLTAAISRPVRYPFSAEASG